MSEWKTTVGDKEYKIVDESFEDDYGSHKSNYVVYSRDLASTDWKQESPGYYALGRMEAEHFIPRKIKTCKECGHITFEPIRFN